MASLRAYLVGVYGLLRGYLELFLWPVKGLFRVVFMAYLELVFMTC